MLYLCFCVVLFFTAFRDRDVAAFLVEGGGVDVTRMRGRGFDWAGLGWAAGYELYAVVVTCSYGIGFVVVI